MKLIVRRCNNAESGGRIIDSILTNTVPPKVSIEYRRGGGQGAELARARRRRRRVELPVRLIQVCEGKEPSWPSGDSAKAPQGDGDQDRLGAISGASELQGNEELGWLSEFRVQLVGELNMLGKSKDVDFDALLGVKATVSMKIDDDHPRYFNGFITRMQQSEATGHGYDGETFAADQVALLDALELERAHVVGHDWGGWTAMLLGILHADRVDRMVVCNAPHPWPRLSARVAIESWRAWYTWVIATPGLGHLVLERPWIARRILGGGNVGTPFTEEDSTSTSTAFGSRLGRTRS